MCVLLCVTGRRVSNIRPSAQTLEFILEWLFLLFWGYPYNFPADWKLQLEAHLTWLTSANSGSYEKPHDWVLLISEGVLYARVVDTGGWHSWGASSACPHFTSSSDTLVLHSGPSLSSWCRVPSLCLRSHLWPLQQLTQWLLPSVRTSLSSFPLLPTLFLWLALPPWVLWEAVRIDGLHVWSSPHLSVTLHVKWDSLKIQFCDSECPSSWK